MRLSETLNMFPDSLLSVKIHYQIVFHFMLHHSLALQENLWKIISKHHAMKVILNTNKLNDVIDLIAFSLYCTLTV